ncbi:MAG: RsbRD N-terminal domain-containing protein [Acidobacteria bacterium]|nr:RsbRD N-terminal domain-containing protein [Acidobacteriota bacterium]
MTEDGATAQTQQPARRVAEMLAARRDEILNLWIKDRLESDEFRDELISKKELRQQSRTLLELFTEAVRDSGGETFEHPSFDDLRRFLNDISHQRAVKGYTPVENATYIISLRNTVRPMLVEEYQSETAAELAGLLGYFANIIDRLSLVMVENYIRSREETIRQQRADMMELSTPVIKVWDKILTLPIIGTLDSRRAQLMMEALLQRVVETGSTVAILMVQLGIDLSQITTRAQMSDGIRLALEMVGKAIISTHALAQLRTGHPANGLKAVEQAAGGGADNGK